MTDRRYGTKWTHDETVIALGLYFQIPFGKINQTTPEVVRIARLMGREPASLSMKMGNIGRLDPTLARRGVSGLVNGAKMEEQVWNEYAGRRDELATRYHELLLKLTRADGVEDTVDDDVAIKTPQGLDGVRLAHYRINQSFFRRSVLSAYDNACCITGLTGAKLLIAVAHNHPSGDPAPSKADLQLTAALQSSARLLGIKFLDHLVLGSADCEDGRGFVSIAEWKDC